MKNIIKNFITHLQSAFWINLPNRFLLALTLIAFGLDYYLWQGYLSGPEQYFVIRLGIYPVQYLAIIIFINTLLALFSYDEDSDVTYLLLLANAIVVYLITILEFFYIFR
ncbi:MAG: hypothetical protein WCO23_00520 [bacterium]